VPPEWGVGKKLGEKLALEYAKVCPDRQGHVLVLAGVKPWGQPVDYSLVYYGTEKTLTAALMEDMNARLFDPRQDASVAFENEQCVITCSKRVVKLAPLPEEKANALLLAAKVTRSTHTRRAHALLRDSTGVYYFVDRGRRDDKDNFRLLVGPKGALQLQKMTNVVTDSEGQIFSTKSGDLRLVIDRQKSSEWVKSGQRTALKEVPIETNLRLIYTELGVYAGERLGNPCDDL
jgi:hypothetical protein